jgi:hypothetical protein
MPNQRNDQDLTLMPRRRVAFPLHSAMAAALGLMLVAGSATATNYPITPAQRSTAKQVATAGVPLSELAPNAPDSHTVKSGDTLWAISGLFLKSPWRWPELWGMNLEQIRNPHLIYPGQVLYLIKDGDRARLSLTPGDGGLPTVKVSPQVRVTNLGPLPLTTIPARLIEPFLTEPLIIEPDVMAAAPRIVAAQEGRVFIGVNDLAYARGDMGAATSFQVFRPAKPLKHPLTGEVMAYESTFVGNADLLRPGKALPVKDENRVVGFFKEPEPRDEAATLIVRSIKQEMGVGDRLLPLPPRELFSYAPRAPDKPVDARVMSIYEGVALAGQNSVVTLTAGKRDGLDRGHVVAVWRAGQTVKDRTVTERNEVVRLPDERYGYLMVFRVFDRVSYAIVLRTDNQVQIGDRVTQP